MFMMILCQIPEKRVNLLMEMRGRVDRFGVQIYPENYVRNTTSGSTP